MTPRVNRLVDKDELKKMIISYLSKRPDSGDTIEGILKWWILKELIDIRVEEVAEVVAVLVREGVLVEREIGGRRKFYRSPQEGRSALDT